MKKMKYTFLLLVLVLIGWNIPAQAQDYKQERAKIAEKQKNIQIQIGELNQQIQQYEQRLKRATQKYEALYQKYQDLKKVIALQDQKIKKLQAEQQQVQKEISVTTNSLEKKREELKQLIAKYKKTLSYLYKHGRTTQLALILSSSSINKMLVRSFYLDKFSSYREKQARQIRHAEKELEKTKRQLVEARQKNKKVLENITREKERLAKKQKQQSQNVALLRENKEEIQQSLQQSKKEKENLNNRFSELIERDEKLRKQQQERRQQLEANRKGKLAAAKKIEDDTKRAKEVAKYSEPIEPANFISSDRLEEIEQKFAQKKGRLPWPVDSRTVSEHFGKTRHPVFGTVTPNPGIEIVTDSQARVRVVEDGYVIAIQPLPGYGDVILVKHGRFITAYGNLSQIMVNSNEILTQGDVIALSGDDNSVKGKSLFFLIRENDKNLDPEKWLQTKAISSAY